MLHIGALTSMFNVSLYYGPILNHKKKLLAVADVSEAIQLMVTLASINVTSYLLICA